MQLIKKLAYFFNWTSYIEFYSKKEKALNYEPHPTSAIELENINMFIKDKHVINNFNFKFKKNLIYGIVGPSGGGKTLLSDHFNGLTKSNTGNIYLFNGEKILFFQKKISNYKKIRKTVGMVLQFPEYQLFKSTVLEDVCFGPEMLGVPKDIAQEQAKKKLLEFGIREEFFDANPFTLSGGQKKKVALSGILAIEPDIVVFDEPTIGLDPHSEKKIIRIIQQLKKDKKTVIIISHNMDLILELCEQLLVMKDGKLMEHGTPYEIFCNPMLDVGKPKVFKFIKKLIERNSKFKVLLKAQPRNIAELSEEISKAVF